VGFFQFGLILDHLLKLCSTESCRCVNIFQHADSFWTAEALGGRALVINRWSLHALCVLSPPKITQVTQKPPFATAAE
jgi:hypothetical protein